MRPALASLFRAAGALALGGAAQASAQLASTSPFLPPQASNAAAPTQNAPLEFRGVLGTEAGVLYRIYDPAKKVGSWAKVNERNPDFGLIVKQYDAQRKTLTVEHEGRTLTLPEREAKIVSSGSPAMVMPPPVAAPVAQPANVMPGVTQSVVVNPTPADEQRRLEAVAAEVARRRALREQASQQMGQGNAPAVAIPQMIPPQAVQQPQTDNVRRNQR